MNNKQIKKNLENGFAKIETDLDDSFLLHVEKEGMNFMPVKKERKIFNYIKYSLATACALVIMVVVGTNYLGGNSSESAKVDTIVQLDVNPSIEIKLNTENKVAEVLALNDDAKVILDDMDLTNTNINTTVNALMGSMLKHGYLNDLANSMLISVENNDTAKAEQIRQEILSNIDQYLKSQSVSVMSQTVSENDEIAKLAKEYNISAGKVSLIKDIISKNDLLKFEDLVKLSINELNLLASKNVATENKVNINGKASDKSYIGEAKALDAAYKHAGVSKANAKNVEIELDYDDGIMCYDIEFYAGNKEYDYEINAKTGKVVEYSTETKNNSSTNTGNSNSNNASNNSSSGSTSTSGNIGSSKALDIAYKHAGVSKSNAKNVEIELDNDRSGAVYDIQFDVGNREYEYEINAKTGAVVEYDSEIDDDDDNRSSNTSSNNTGTSTSNKTNTSTNKNYIGNSKALSIALKHARSNFRYGY